MYQHQALWDNRQYPKVHQAFAEILRDEKLWVSLDRANMKPPARASRVEAWQERRPQPNWPGDPRDWEHEHQEPAVLTELGRKLLGADSWN